MSKEKENGIRLSSVLVWKIAGTLLSALIFVTLFFGGRTLSRIEANVLTNSTTEVANHKLLSAKIDSLSSSI